MEKFTIKYDNTDGEIETAYKAFQKKYMMRRNVLFTIVYAIAAGVGIFFMIDNHTNFAGYALFAIGAAMLVSTWLRPVQARKKLMRTLAGLNVETYTAEFGDKTITIDTEILPNDEEAETEIVATDRNGTRVVDESEVPDDAEIEDQTQIKHDKTKIELTGSGNTLDSAENEDMFMLFVNRSLIYIFPKRCLSEEEIKKLGDYFEEKNI